MRSPTTFSASSGQWFRAGAVNTMPPPAKTATTVPPPTLATVAEVVTTPAPVAPASPTRPVEKSAPIAPAAAELPTLNWKKFPGWTERVRRGQEKGIFTETVTIHPELARLILGNNAHNRKLSAKVEVPRLKRALLAGNWEHNGETIKIAVGGELNDGQNRLQACSETGIPIKSEVTFGLPRESRVTVDIGVVRNIRHVMHMHNMPYATAAAHGAGLVIAFQAGRPRFDLESTADRSTPDEILRWLVEHPDFIQDLNEANRLYGKLSVSRGVMAALIYLFRQRDPKATKILVERLWEGVWPGLTAQDPMFRLREYIRSQRPFTRRGKYTELAAVAIRAFNALRRGSKVARLHWSANGTDEFPVLDE